jgi:hypothetical protein
MRSIIIYTLHKILGWSNGGRSDWQGMQLAWNRLEIHRTVGKPEGKRWLWRFRHRCEEKWNGSYRNILWVWIGFTSSVMASCCEHVNEFSGSIKRGNFFISWITLASQRLCYVKLVSWQLLYSVWMNFYYPKMFTHTSMAKHFLCTILRWKVVWTANSC